MSKKKRKGRDLRLYVAFLLVFLAGLLFPRNFDYPAGNVSLPKLILSDPEILSSSFGIVAVNADGVGAVGSVSAEVRKGEGRVLLNTNPFIETDTQESIEVAKEVAEKAAGFSLKDKDVIITFNINGLFVGGHSAGAATATALAAAILGESINESVLVTGTINNDGVVGQIGSVIEKAQAAGESGKELFLVPKGQGNMSYYERVVSGQKTVGGATLTTYSYVPKVFDLNNYSLSEWGMRVAEVGSLSDVLNYALNS